MIIRKLFKAEAAHRVLGAYTERCRGLHGHSYLFEVFIAGKDQDEAQMLMDFKLLKEKFNPLLDSFDHSLMVWEEDQDLMKIASLLNPRYVILPYNPTAEQIARHIYYAGQELELSMRKVIVHETATGFAEFAGDDDIPIDIERVIFSEAIKSGNKTQ